MDLQDNPPESLFRPAKKRKFLRRRPDPEPEDHDSAEQSAPSPYVSSADNPTQPGHANPLRRPPRPRRGGIEFSASSRQVTDPTQPAEPSAEELEGKKIRAMCDRFTGHTGQSVDVDKHMMNYIESEMSKRHRPAPTDPTDSHPSNQNERAGRQSTPDLPQREPASLGKLHEIDLGHETKLRNIARTEAATKKLTDDDVVSEDSASQSAPPKEEKRRKNRKRRNSEDVERDRLVEEVLRESKLDVYDEPEEERHSDDQAADDKIAEQFRREFLDAIQSRRRVARAKNTKPAKTEPPKGPKLGGSRSARAAMREMQEKGQK